MENITSKTDRIRKVQVKKTSVKVVHTVHEISQKELDEERSSAYSYIL